MLRKTYFKDSENIRRIRVVVQNPAASGRCIANDEIADSAGSIVRCGAGAVGDSVTRADRSKPAER